MVSSGYCPATNYVKLRLPAAIDRDFRAFSDTLFSRRTRCRGEAEVMRKRFGVGNSHVQAFLYGT